MVTIGWVNTADSEKLQNYEGMALSPYFTIEPEKYVRKMVNKNNKRMKFAHCPANVQFQQNVYVIRAGLNLELQMFPPDRDHPTWDLRPTDLDAIDPQALKRMIAFEPFPEGYVDPEKPVIQYRTSYCFYADEPVTMQLLPVINEPYERPGITICGEFDIHAWQRSIQWAFEWWDTSKVLTIKKGDPLFYLKFVVHKDPSEKVKLVRLKANDATMQPILRANNVGHFTRRTFDLFDIARKWRAPKYITKENLWKPGD